MNIILIRRQKVPPEAPFHLKHKASAKNRQPSRNGPNVMAYGTQVPCGRTLKRCPLISYKAKAEQNTGTSVAIR